MRAILINPLTRSVTRVLDEFNDQKILHFYLQASVATSFALGPGHQMIVDEFGPFRKQQLWFGIKGQPVSIAGRGIILGHPVSPEDGFTSCQMDVGAVERTLRWFDDPAEAEALVPPSRITAGRLGKTLEEVPFAGFRTMDKELIDRNGKVMVYDPTA